MNSELSYSTTLPGDTVRVGEAECVVVKKSARERRLTLRRTTGTHWERRFVNATERQYDAARPVLIRAKGRR